MMEGGFIVPTAKQQVVLNELSGKRAAVLGIGLRSGVPLIRFLHQQGCIVVACDLKPKEKLQDVFAALADVPVEYVLGPDYLSELKGCDFLFRTPGMRPDLPEISDAVAAGAKLTSEIELVFALAEAAITGVTGSDGKSTTTTLVYEMLKADGRSVSLGGNIGHSLIEEVLDIGPDADIVLELSSFQLMGMEQSPSTAIVTNITPNHLDYHGTMDEYIEAKMQIFQHQASNDILVLNWDNEVTRMFAEQADSRVFFFSRQEAVPQGAWLRGSEIILKVHGREEVLCQAEEISLPGSHNVENVMAAAIAASAKRVSLQAIRQVATTFKTLEHRLEFVRELHGVKYYNNSIASSPTRTIAGLNALQVPTVLIVGGYDKHIPFEPLAQAVVGRVDAIALIGQTATKIEQSIQDVLATRPADLAMQKFATLDAAVSWAQTQAKPGSAVVLAPACASFDMFRDFEERGRVFKQLVEQLR